MDELNLDDHNIPTIHAGALYILLCCFFVVGNSKCLLPNPNLVSFSPYNLTFIDPYGMPCNVVARSLRRRSIKIIKIPTIAGTPTPIPTPSQTFSPVLEEEVSPIPVGETTGAAVFDPEGVVVGLEYMLDGVDEVLLVVLIVLELETPIVAAKITRLFIAQHCSELKFNPQHQVPSVEHWDIPKFWLDDPPFCLHQHMVLPTSPFLTYPSTCAYSS